MTADTRPASISAGSFPGLRALLERHVGEGDIAGAVVAIAVGDAEPVYVCVGETGFGTGRAIGPESIHRIYSQTKPVTGIATMMLIEEGAVGLDQPVGEFLPDLQNLQVLVSPDGDAVRPAARQPTVRDLLTHTAGFSYGLQASPLATRYRALGLQPGTRIAAHRTVPHEPATLAELVRILGTLPLNRDPGQMFEYSISIDVLGALIEAVSGKPLEQFFRERIFGPLGMDDTGFVVPPAKLDRLVNLHEKQAGGDWALIDSPAASAYARPALASGGGGLVSTARDYMRFAAMLAGDGETRGVRVLGAEALRLARSNLLPPGEFVQFFGNVMANIGFGAAMQVDLAATRMPAGTFGWGGAAGTGLWVDPVHRLQIVLMTQYMPTDINMSLRVSPANAVYDDLGLWPTGPRALLG